MSSTLPLHDSVLQSRRTVYVGGLAERTTTTSTLEPTLRAAFIPFGPIQSIDIPMDYAKGTHKGFAFIEYQDAEDATECIDNMDGSELFGGVLVVTLAQQRQLLNSTDGNNKAVWSTDEWFQQQQQQKDEVMDQRTDATLKEQGPIMAK